MALHVSSAGASQHAAASIDTLALLAAPIYGALIAPWVSLVNTDGGRPKSLELAVAALAQAQMLYAVASSAPVNIHVPYVSQEGSELSCTMGEWWGEPTSYGYQWYRDGTTAIGTDAATYAVVAADAGHSITCVVTATNAGGSTAAPPSNDVVIAAAMAA